MFPPNCHCVTYHLVYAYSGTSAMDRNRHPVIASPLRHISHQPRNLSHLEHCPRRRFPREGGDPGGMVAQDHSSRLGDTQGKDCQDYPTTARHQHEGMCSLGVVEQVACRREVKMGVAGYEAWSRQTYHRSVSSVCRVVQLANHVRRRFHYWIGEGLPFNSLNDCTNMWQTCAKRRFSRGVPHLSAVSIARHPTM